VEGDATDSPVYWFRVRGTGDFDLVHEVLQPDGTIDPFPVSLRRAIGLVRLAGDDRNDRDLRLVQGSALDRLLSDKGLRSRLGMKLAQADIKTALSEKARTAISVLDTAFHQKRLPHNLDVGLIGGPGASVTALIGLTAKNGTTELPMTSWGAGTRRLAALSVAEANQGEAPVTLVDEAERGLEPYRQRVLVNALQEGKSQAFVTTHSPSVISAAAKAHFWYVDHSRAIGPLDSEKISRHRSEDAETFLARLAIVAEGKTEVGFVSALLERALGGALTTHGIHVCDGGGHENALELLEALSAGGLKFGGFVDEEGKHPTRWEKVGTKQQKLLFRWTTGCTEQNLIGEVQDSKLESLLVDPQEQKTGTRLRYLADRLNFTGKKEFTLIKEAAGDALRATIIAAAIGLVPEGTPDEEKKAYKSHGQQYFKSVAGGRELASKMFSLQIWPAFKPRLLPFCNAVRGALGLAELEDIVL
jgi:putative ATP-dependent endonuclease of OLD family